MGAGFALVILLAFAPLQLAFALPEPASIQRRLFNEIHLHHEGSFDALLASWGRRYGTRAVPALIRITRDTAATDSERYVALMGAAKIGGKETAPSLSVFLKDPSWMIRNAALRALTALGHPDTALSVLPLLKDPALVVRLEAVQSVTVLNPPGSAHALLETLDDPANFPHGKALWVPQKALEALLLLRSRGVLSGTEYRETTLKLASLLKDTQDPSLAPQLASTLRKLRFSTH